MNTNPWHLNTIPGLYARSETLDFAIVLTDHQNGLLTQWGSPRWKCTTKNIQYTLPSLIAFQRPVREVNATQVGAHWCIEVSNMVCRVPWSMDPESVYYLQLVILDNGHPVAVIQTAQSARFLCCDSAEHRHPHLTSEAPEPYLSVSSRALAEHLFPHVSSNDPLINTLAQSISQKPRQLVKLFPEFQYCFQDSVQTSQVPVIDETNENMTGQPEPSIARNQDEALEPRLSEVPAAAVAVPDSSRGSFILRRPVTRSMTHKKKFAK
jgi:hypothetical protein